MDPITVELPIYLKIGVKKKKTFSLNLNTYRNTHFQTLNKVKILFHDMVTLRIGHLPRMTKVRLRYSLFFGSERDIDIANICTVVDKFFCDTLVNSGKLSDDNRKVISDIRFEWGGVDVKNPRVDVTLDEIEVAQETEQPMQITLVQSEIEDALRAFVLNQIAIRDDQTINFEFKATRGEEGIVATLNIGKSGETTVTAMTSAASTLSQDGQTAHMAQAAQATTAPRTRRTAPKVEDTKIEEEPKKTEPAPQVRSNPEDRQPEAEPEKPAETKTEEVKQEVKQQAVTTPVAAPKTIFPSAKSSAPTPPALAPTQEGTASNAPKPGPKSLFANLTPPKHDTPAAPAV